MPSFNEPVSPWIHKCLHVLRQDGHLKGTSFAVKGMIPVAGEVPSLGNPALDSEQDSAQNHAACLLPLLTAGANLLGTTVLDELALGVTGANPHTGTPTNPNAPDRVPGGSSSGSAVVVASGEVDFALGTDTGGSIRVPASWCGVFGWRPSFGLITLVDVPLNSPSLDVVGVLASRVPILEAVALSYGCQPAVNTDAPQLLWVRDFAKLADTAVSGVFSAELTQRSMRLQETSLAELFAPLPMTTDLLTKTFLDIGMYEVSLTRSVLSKTHPNELSLSMYGLLDAFSQVSHKQYMEALETREQIRTILASRLIGRMLVFPTTPGPAPLRQASSGSPADTDNCNLQTLQALSSITGFPQLSLPFASEQGKPPCGLSLLASPGCDMELLFAANLLLANSEVAHPSMQSV